jgi:hypothetical protein
MSRNDGGQPRKLASLSKETETTIKGGRDQVRAEIRTGLEEMEATESAANQEKTEAVGEHYNRSSGVKAAHGAPDVLHRDPKGAT